jgi:hypothetical protein
MAQRSTGNTTGKAGAKGKAPKGGARPVGRPRLEFDLDLVERLGKLHCTDEELAAALETTRQTIADRKLNDPEFLYRLEKGRGDGKMSLRRQQVAAAESGNVTMMIWLGKQMLGQADKHEHTGKDGGPISFTDLHRETGSGEAA